MCMAMFTLALSSTHTFVLTLPDSICQLIILGSGKRRLRIDKYKHSLLDGYKDKRHGTSLSHSETLTLTTKLDSGVGTFHCAGMVLDKS